MVKKTVICFMLLMSASIAHSTQSNNISSSANETINLNEKLLQAKELSNPKSHNFDIKKAMFLYIEEVNKRNPLAEYELAKIYDDGELIDMDIDRAIKLYQLSSEQNHGDALYALALKYRDGDGVRRDNNKFFTLIKKSASTGNPLAQLYLARLLRHGAIDSKLSERQSQAAVYYILSARQNNPAAQLELGDLYSTGEALPVDLNKKIKMYQLATRSSYPKSFLVLGTTYLNGIKGFLLPNKEKAIATFRQGAVLAEPKCQVIFGILSSEVMNGEKKDYDFSRGYSWIKLASLNGDKNATDVLQSINKKSSAKFIDKMEAETQALIKKHPEYLRNKIAL